MPMSSEYFHKDTKIVKDIIGGIVANGCEVRLIIDNAQAVSRILFSEKNGCYVYACIIRQNEPFVQLGGLDKSGVKSILQVWIFDGIKCGDVRCIDDAKQQIAAYLRRCKKDYHPADDETYEKSDFFERIRDGVRSRRVETVLMDKEYEAGKYEGCHLTDVITA